MRFKLSSKSRPSALKQAKWVASLAGRVWAAQPGTVGSSLINIEPHWKVKNAKHPIRRSPDIGVDVDGNSRVNHGRPHSGDC